MDNNKNVKGKNNNKTKQNTTTSTSKNVKSKQPKQTTKNIKPKIQTKAIVKVQNPPSSKNIKSRVNKRDTSKDKNIKIASFALIIFIVVMFYIFLGWFFALITILGITMIVGLGKLLKKCKGKKSGKILKIIKHEII